MLDNMMVTDPTTPREVLEHRLKPLDRRRAEIEAALEIEHKLRRGPQSFKAQELETELADLSAQRREIESALRPKPKPTADAITIEKRKRFLVAEIAEQTKQIEAFCAKLGTIARRDYTGSKSRYSRNKSVKTSASTQA
jgi:hypothetical protein